MSHDPALNALVAADPLGGGNRIALGFLRTYLASTPGGEPENFTACPVLMVHPPANQWTPTEVSLPFYQRLPGEKRLVLLDNAGHMPTEEPALTQLATAITDFVAPRADQSPRRNQTP